MNMILFGPAAGCIAGALEAFAGSMRCKTKARRVHFVLFNTGNVALCTYVSGLVYCAIRPATRMPGFLLAGFALALCYYLLNSWTVSLMLALDSGHGVCRIWKENFLWMSGNYLACSVAAILLTHSGTPATPLVLSVAGIVVLIIYTSFRTALERLAANAGG
jgi:hypothetical protein